MSKPELSSIYAMMPERQQALGFVEHVKTLITDSSVEKAKTFFNALCQVEGCNYAKIAVGSALITGCLDIGDKDLATEIYRYMETLGTDEEILLIRANALLNLSAFLLPDQTGLALDFWERLDDAKPPLEALYAMTKIGVGILKVALPEGDEETKDRVYRRLYPDMDAI